MSVSTLLIIASVLIYATNSRFCAWNRGKKYENENGALTYNFLNGNFERWTEFENEELYNGYAYYRSVMPDYANCWVGALYLYRYVDYNFDYDEDNPYQHWVISAVMGTRPEYSYAYCGFLTGVSSAQSLDLYTPADELCAGKWYVGDPADPSDSTLVAGHELDANFQVMVGGCPEVTCSSIRYCSGSSDIWAGYDETDNTRNYDDIEKQHCVNYVKQDIDDTANVYLAGQDQIESGAYYMFFNPRTMRWAHDNNFDAIRYHNCELYKDRKGFDAVANVKEPFFTSSSTPIELSWPTAGNLGTLGYTGEDIRYIECIGTATSPSPTTATTFPPSVDLADKDWESVCATFVKLYVKAYCGILGIGFGSDTFTGSPTSPPTTPSSSSSGSTPSGSGSSGNTPSPNSSSGSTPSPNSSSSGSTPSPNSNSNSTSSSTSGATITSYTPCSYLLSAITLFIIYHCF